MRFSLALVPLGSANELIDMIVVADRLGFYGSYAADHISYKDQWIVNAAAALKTEQIRLSPGVTPVLLRDPALVAQATATLDELTGGRAELVYSVGDPDTVKGVFHRQFEPVVPRLREAHHVLRTLLDEGELTFAGDYFTYSGYYTAAAPVQSHLPIKMGAMTASSWFRVAGALSDGVHQAYSTSRAALEFGMDNARSGVEESGSDWNAFDRGMWTMCAIAEDRDTAMAAARVALVSTLPGTTDRLLALHSLSREDVAEPLRALEAGDVTAAGASMSVELLESLAFFGTPDDWVSRLSQDALPGGVNHFIAGLVDPRLVAAWGMDAIPGLGSTADQLQLIHDYVMPAFVRSA